ncbi:ATP-binding cassette domain-containing protein [Fulvivirga sp. RKSG066]|uniref:ABC transporter ATP-binding protein n=1 Tax=Fulvivirga aurantia TaxID=2529383 RepID=UPI0012BCEE8A|nr:ATP-binding cassette domain-containing protein [Fulvivirga aurantia]MTI21347.1 ATP-binding cassette domain-containing protein [Fulvivirga aurantia]
MLEVDGLCKKYDETLAVNQVSFNVPKGNTLVLLGTSGCGKTTTLKIINRLIEKTSGTVRIHGKDTSAIDAIQLRRDIGYVIQETGLFPHYTIEQNLSVVPELLGWKKPAIEKRVDELLELIGLEKSIKTRMPGELSGGQRQRIGLGRAIAADPSLILLDEPFGALDPITRKEMQEEFRKLEGALEKAMVLVTHDVNEAVILGDQICLMDKGQVQQIGSPVELLFKPANSFVKRFFNNKRLELEPAIVRLSDLAFVLEPTTNNQGVEVDPNLTISQALELETDLLVFKLNGTYYSVEDLLKVYYNHRHRIIAQIEKR